MYRKLFIALVAGLALPLAFAPFYLYSLAVIAPALLIYCWLNTKPSHAFLYGLVYGIGFFGLGVSWVFISMHRFGNLPVPIATLFTALFVITLSLFPALQGYLLKRYFLHTMPAKLWLAVPASFALVDWLRSWLFSGFPWLLLGYSQTNSPLKGYAPILGEYGLGFILTLTSALLVFCYLQIKHKKPFCKIILPLGIMGVIWLTGYALSKVEWTKPTGNSIKVSLVQGNIPQQLKWQADFLNPTLERYGDLTKQHWNSDLIIWPEAAIPLVYQDAKEFLTELGQAAKQHHTRVLLGIPYAADNESYYNALYLIGDGSGHYYKRQLVPFGEYLPFHKELTWLFNYWQIPMSSLISGPNSQATLKVNGFTIAPFICYEIAYAKLVERISANTGFLVTVSNDAWFGESLAPAQHLQIAQFRSLSTQRASLVTTNNGITAIIDEYGEIIESLPPFTTAVLSGKIIARTGTTPLLIINSTMIICLLWLAVLIGYLLRNMNSLGK
jgi:apolipoprotein N-acyltransferase